MSNRKNDSRLVFDRVCLEGLEAAKRALPELSLMHNPVRLLSKHTLDEVDCVIEDDSVSFCPVCCCRHGLDLHTLHDRVDNILACEDAAQTALGDGRVRVVGHVWQFVFPVLVM